MTELLFDYLLIITLGILFFLCYITYYYIVFNGVPMQTEFQAPGNTFLSDETTHNHAYLHFRGLLQKMEVLGNQSRASSGLSEKNNSGQLLLENLIRNFYLGN